MALGASLLACVPDSTLAQEGGAGGSGGMGSGGIGSGAPPSPYVVEGSFDAPPPSAAYRVVDGGFAIRAGCGAKYCVRGRLGP